MKIIPTCHKCGNQMLYLRGIPRVNGLDVPNWKEAPDFEEFGCAADNEFAVVCVSLKAYWHLSEENPPLSPNQWRLIGKRPQRR